MKKEKGTLTGILSGCLVFLSGFAVMYFMWVRLGSHQGLPGFFSYRAATIGDGICLPILTGAMVMFMQRNKVFYRQRRKVCAIMSLIAALIAVGIQASWLIRDDTVLNWSIPIPHHFNVAGWYHSLFFVAIFGIVAYQLCAIWFILKDRKTEYVWAEKVIYAFFVFAGALFLLMHVTDDYEPYLPISNLLTIAAAGILLLCVIYIKTADRMGGRELLSATAMGIITAYSASTMICMQAQGNVVIALSGGLCVCFIWRIHNLSFPQMILKDIWAIVCYFAVLYKVSALTDIWELGGALVFLIVITVVCEENSNKQARSRAVSLLAVEAYIMLNIFPVEIKEINIFTNLLFMAAVCSLFGKEIKDYFSEVKKAEGEIGKNRITKERYKEIKAKVYLQIVIGILAAVLLILHWILGVAGKMGIAIEAGNVYLPIGLVGIILCIIGILVLLGAEKLRKYTVVKAATLLFSVFSFVCLVTCIALNIREASVQMGQPLNLALLGCSVCACIGTGILSAHGYYMNMVWLRGLHTEKFVAVMALAQGLGGMAVSFAITVLILCRQTWKGAILVGIVTIMAFIIIPLLHARVFQCGYRNSHVVENKPLGGIAQDGLMICLIVFFVICMPCLYINLSARGISAWLGALTLVCTAFLPIRYCLRNNVEHIRKQRKVLAQYPEEEKIWDALHECLVRQSKQTVFAAFPYVCIAIVAAYGSRMMKSLERGDIPKDIYNTYIDADDYDSEDTDGDKEDN